MRLAARVLALWAFWAGGIIPPSATADTWPANPLIRPDADGGATMLLLLDDGEGGLYEYLPVRAADVEQEILAATGQSVSLGDVREIGYFKHQWSFGTAPMVTLGLYVESGANGRLRLPLVLFENQDAPEPVLLFLLQFVQGDILYFPRNQLPFLLNWAFPDVVGVIDGPTTTYGDYRGYPFETEHATTYPTVYAWIARKEAGAASVWLGLYVERTGSASGDSAASHAEKRVALGVAQRVNGVETKTAGLSLNQEAAHNLSGSSFSANQSTDHGIVLLGADVAAIRLATTDDRAGNDFRRDVKSRQDVQLGLVGPDGDYVPLVQSRTDDARHPAGAGDQSERRVSTFGVVAPGIGYVPLVGTGYVADRSSLLLFPQNFYFGGLFGGQGSGDAEWSLGTAVGGDYQPLLALSYRDDVPGAPRAHQGLLTIGTYVDGEPQPLVGVAYNGDRLPQEFLLGFLGDQTLGSDQTGDATFTLATFVDGVYTPLLGVDYLDHLEGWPTRYAHQTMIRVGIYEDGTFAPLLGLAYDGEQKFSGWTSAFSLGGTLGAPADKAGSWEVAAGPFVGAAFQPVLGAQYQPVLPGGQRAFQSLLSVGTYSPANVAACAPSLTNCPPADYQPLLGTGYDGEQPFSLWAAAFETNGGLGSREALDWTISLGTFVPGAGVNGYTPLGFVDYRDDFAEGTRPFQSRVTIGVGPGNGTELFAATYEGDLTFGEWLQAFSGQDRSTIGGWTIAAGTAALGKYAPLMGVRYSSEDGLRRAYGESFDAGVFPGGYASYLPLLQLRLDGNKNPYDWTGSFIIGGTLGSGSGDFEVETTGGATVLYTADLLVVDDEPYEGIVIGVHDSSGFQPVAGAGYRDDHGGGLVRSLRDDHAFAITAGPFVNGTYTPVATLPVPERGLW